jgi:hypothetical protein
MRLFIKPPIIQAAALGAGALAFGLALNASPAHATLIVSANVGGTLFQCNDNAACDTNPTIGTIALGSTTTPLIINGVDILGSVTTSTGTTSTPGIDRLSSSSLSVTNTNLFAVTVTGAFGDTSFIGPANFFSTSGSGTFVNNIGGTLTLNYFDDPLNRQGADGPPDGSANTPGNLIDTFTSTPANDSSFSTSHNNAGALAVPDGALYSMTEQFIFNLDAATNPDALPQLISRGQTETKINVVPEPTSLFLIGTALCGVGLLRRMRRS